MAKAKRIPRFGVDEGQFGTLVLGRRFTQDLTVAQVKAVHATTEAWRNKTGLPLVFVSPGAAADDLDDDIASEFFFAGLLVAAAKDGGKPVKVAKEDLDPSKLDSIPADFWKALDEEHELSLSSGDAEEEDEDLGAPTGLFLAPAGWAVATVYLGSPDDEYIATTSSEDTTIGKRLDEAQIAAIQKAKEPLILVGAYC